MHAVWQSREYDRRPRTRILHHRQALPEMMRWTALVSHMSAAQLPTKRACVLPVSTLHSLQHSCYAFQYSLSNFKHLLGDVVMH